MGECIKVVASDPSQDLGKTLVDLLAVRGGELTDRTVCFCLERFAGTSSFEFGGRQGTEVSDRCIREHDALLKDMINGLPVNQRPGAAGVVGHHPTNGGATSCRNIRSKAQAMGAQSKVELVEHNSWLNSCPSLSRVYFQNGIQVFRCVQHNAIANGLSSLGCTSAASGNGNTIAAAYLDHTHDVVSRARQYYAQRLNLVHACVA